MSRFHFDTCQFFRPFLCFHLLKPETENHQLAPLQHVIDDTLELCGLPKLLQMESKRKFLILLQTLIIQIFFDFLVSYHTLFIFQRVEFLSNISILTKSYLQKMYLNFWAKNKKSEFFNFLSKFNFRNFFFLILRQNCRDLNA